MARRRVAGIRRPAPATTKAAKGGSVLPGGLALPAAGIATDATGLLQAIQAQSQANSVDTTNRPLPRDQGFWAPFGPGAPLFPAPLNPADPQTGQPAPRRWEYPVSWNLQGQGQKLVDWATLRTAGDSVDVIRRCIEIRKSELVQLEWDITPSRRALQRAGANTPGEKAAMREKYAAHIERAIEFWEKPDQQNGLSFSAWLWMLLEEYFVVDAVSIYPRVTYGGDLHSLNLIDGATVKPLLDEYGNTPLPPAPAFQQYLWGFPRGEYTAGSGADLDVPAGAMLYRPRHVRTWTPYGYSPVEQALVSADIYLHRQQWMLAEYTEGTLPTSFLKTDLSANLTPEQIRAWEASLNDFYQGSNQNRHRFRLLPNGFDPVPTADAAERYRPDYDEFLVKLLASHFDVDPEELGISQRNGLGGSGYAAAQQDSKYRSGIKPLCEWLTDIFDDINHRFLGIPRELTFSWLGMEQEDEASADTVANERVGSGRMTWNEERDRLGLPRFEGEWADKPALVTPTGPVWLEDAWEDAQITVGPMGAPMPMAPGEGEPGAAGQEPSGGGGSGGGGGRGSGGQGLPSVKPRGTRQNNADRFALGDRQGGRGGRDGDGDGIVGEKADDAKRSELAAYRKWVRKGNRARPFEWHHHTDPEVAELTKAGGGAGGRGEAPAGRTGPAGPRPRGETPPGGYQAGFAWPLPGPGRAG